MTNEIWKEIPDYDGYLVSNFGRVKSFKFKTPRILKPALRNDGYLQLNLFKDGKQKHFCVHRLVAEAFIPNSENKFEVNHKDEDKTNNRVENLEWVTRKENLRHAVEQGLKKSGEDHFRAALTNEQVVCIRNNPCKLTITQLAEKFQVSKSTIGEIQLGEKYKTAGGVIREKIDRRITDNIREEIRQLFKPYDREFGARALSKKYGIGIMTIWRIIHERRWCV